MVGSWRRVRALFSGKNITIYAVLLLMVLCVVSVIYAASTINPTSGSSYYVQLEDLSDTAYWAGLKIVNSGNSVSEGDTNTPITSLTVSNPVITTVQFDGDNLKDGVHYYAAMQVSNFSSNNIVNITLADIFQNGIFDSSAFPQFYPNYNNLSDNPNETWCCTTSTIPIGGQNFTAFNITIEDGISYYLTRYDDGGTPRPLFLVPFRDQTCYNSTSCVGEMLLPISSDTYYFYVLSERQVYDINVFVDDVDTNTISQTALPYLVRLKVTDLFTGDNISGIDVFVGETSGHNLFVPYRLTGEVSEEYSITPTNSTGEATFLIAPTAYPPNTNYTIFAGIYAADLLTNRESLTITNMDGTVSQSKSVSPTTLSDDAKASINTMNQIVSFMFTWASDLERARSFEIEYELSTGNFSYDNLANSSIDVQLKTGIPNVITLDVENLGVSQSGYSMRMRESDGYLLLNPYTGSTPYAQTDRQHRMEADTNTNLVITPTSLGVIVSNVTIEVIAPGGSVIDEINLTVDPTLDEDISGTVSFDDDTLKSLINSMNIVVNSMFTALNT